MSLFSKSLLNKLGRRAIGRKLIRWYVHADISLVLVDSPTEQYRISDHSTRVDRWDNKVVVFVENALTQDAKIEFLEQELSSTLDVIFASGGFGYLPPRPELVNVDPSAFRNESFDQSNDQKSITSPPGTFLFKILSSLLPKDIYYDHFGQILGSGREKYFEELEKSGGKTSFEAKKIHVWIWINCSYAGLLLCIKMLKTLLTD